MRTSIIALLAVCGGGLGAADPALAVMVPDTARLAQRLRTAGWDAIFDAPAVAALLTAADPGRPAWASLLHGGGQGRARLDWGAPVGGLPVLSATWAIGSPADPPGAALPARANADGAWRYAGLSAGDLGQPELPALPSLGRDDDVQWRFRPSSVGHLLPEPRAEAWRSLLKAWRIDAASGVVALAEAVPERGALAGAWLPVRAVDPAALAGLPGGLRLVAVCGLDGAALEESLPHLVALATGQDAETASVWLEERLGLDWKRAAAALDGTLLVALVGDPAAPGIIVGLPGGPDQAAILERWLTSAHPEPDDAAQAAIREQVASSAEQAVPAGSIAGVPLFVRRDRGRVWLASAPGLLAQLGPDAGPFAMDTRWPAADGAALLAWWDAGMAARAASRLIADGPVRRVLAELASPPGWLGLRQEADGVAISGAAAVTGMVPAASLAIAAAPALAASLRSAGESAARERMARILDRCLSFRKATGDQWPRDIEDLRAWAKDLTDDDFAAAGRPDIRLPFRYVPAAAGAPADQPVLVEDPACRDGQGGLVGFADGRIEYRPGPAHWNEARRLQAKPGIREHGITVDEWATIPKTF